MRYPLVISIILNSSRRDDTLDCLKSLRQSNYTNHQILVLDCQSTDNSIAAIRKNYPDIRIIELSENLGYAGNNNIGIQTAIELGADWVLVLNEDTILDADCISKLVEAGLKDAQIGVVGPIVYHYDEPAVIQSAGGLLGKYWQSVHLGMNETDHGQFSEPRVVDWISGCAIMVRREAIEHAGMLDPNYFIYWEETEWCIRLSRASWKILNVPKAKIWHKGVQRNYQPKPSFTYYATRNHLFTLWKHRAPVSVKIYNWFQLVRTLASWTIKPKWRAKLPHRNAMLLGVLHFLQNRSGSISI